MIGELWAALSGGRCRFVMVEGRRRDWIEEKLQQGKFCRRRPTDNASAMLIVQKRLPPQFAFNVLLSLPSAPGYADVPRRRVDFGQGRL